MVDRATVERYRGNWQSEIDAAVLYRAMAEGEENAPVAELYERLAAAEDRHATFWAERLEDAGRAPGPPRPSGRARVLAWLARRCGAALVAPTVAADERRDQGMYDDQPETAGTGMRADERGHARVLARALSATHSSGLSGSQLVRVEGRHRGLGGNALRAAVLGANDGLVSNASLVMGVAGAAAGGAIAPGSIAIAGVAGLLAGAGSMAMGEWISVTSAREAAQRQLDVEADELAEHPEEEAEELRLIYQARGLEESEARRIAERLMRDPDLALEAQARDELGIDPDDLGGSPRVAAATSFLLFALGAVIPVVPFVVFTGGTAVLVSVFASALGLFALGAAITLFTGRGVLLSGVRQLLIGAGAAAVTYGVGALLGVTVAG